MDYTYEQLNEYPLRILVPSDAVGAIIGKQGSTVKQIKQTTHAKIDVNKGAASTSSERLMVIRGQPENCLQACREILLIMSTDARNKNKSVELVLKVLAHNNFIGRIIGKGGNIINAIKKDTETNITVSSVNEHHSNDIDRIISIKGELDQQLRALEMIYSKLCLAFEHDQARGWDYASTAAAAAAASPYYQEHLVHYINQQSVAGPPLMSTQYAQAQSNGINSPSTKYLEQPSQANVIYPPAYYPPIYSAGNPYYMSYPPAAAAAAPGLMPAFHPYPYANGALASQQQHYLSQSGHTGPVANETVHLYVPSTAIGAIIGAKGLFIKSIIKNSNASVKVTALSADEDQTKLTEREIVISGTPEAQWKSQYYIYDRLRQEGYMVDDEDVRLRAEIHVPTTLIGRLVGKGGQNVRQLQQSTGAQIKLPEDSQQTSAREIPVKIFGTFQASQFAQRRIQSIIQMSRDAPSNGSSTEPSNSIVQKSSNDSSATASGSSLSDDAVVASSTLPNTDHRVTGGVVDEQKTSDE